MKQKKGMELVTERTVDGFRREKDRMAQKRKMHVCCFIAFQEAGNLRNSILSWVQRFQSQDL